jgi:hypothetical protein
MGREKVVRKEEARETRLLKNNIQCPARKAIARKTRQGIVLYYLQSVVIKEKKVCN